MENVLRVAELKIDGFRGFDTTQIRPRGDVVLVGEPRAGRSDIVAALERVLHPDGTWWQVREWDFHGGDLDRVIAIEVTLSELGTMLRQQFIRRVEAWDQCTHRIVPESDEPLAAAGLETALRLPLDMCMELGRRTC